MEQRRPGARSLLADLDAYIDDFADFVASAPSSYHAAGALAGALAATGFEAHDETEAWAPVRSGSRGFVVRDGALIAWRAGEGVDATSPVRVLGAHTDSPGFALKPRPDFTADGWAQAGVEVYGGPLINSWLDRDLGFAGRFVTRDGAEHLVRTAAVARIPQLAIHLDREANTGLVLDRQRHVQPVLAAGAEGVSVLELLAREVSPPRGGGAAASSTDGGIPPGDVVGADVRLYDTQYPQRIGARADLFASPRLDNLSSTFAGLVALIESEPAPGTIAVLAAFDHEELGSGTRSGASGPFLSDVLGRIRAGLGASAEDAARANARSWCLSADAGHSVHPNYPEKHDPRVRPLAGRGPMLKVNANQRYASDAHGAALWRGVCEVAGVATQEFVSNNTVPCGSTIGPLTATRLGIRTVDVGVPLLSMHSARELAHVDDLHGLARAIGAFFA
ncbi:M18 family aminopeptidase [Leucobacter sp. wl10]|uniref:M18 family aminopeptidase n=1 Tax=Leucobacter sp. wl10 TaxID=2304677 RepID=UPI001968ABEA|nr:M18 family aminopeptidase [Leucobacter sp. wl10]